MTGRGAVQLQRVMLPGGCWAVLAWAQWQSVSTRIWITH